MAASEARIKSRSRITAQASGALTASYAPSSDSYTGGAATVIDNTYDGGSENGLGSMWLNLELDITTAPSTAATADIYYRGSEDNTNWTAWRYSHTVGADIATSAARYAAGIFAMDAYQYVELKVKANSYGFTSTLYATPKLVEAQ